MNRFAKVFMMVVIEPGASPPENNTVEIELNVKRRKTVLNGVECCEKGFDGKSNNFKLSEIQKTLLH